MKQLTYNSLGTIFEFPQYLFELARSMSQYTNLLTLNTHLVNK